MTSHRARRLVVGAVERTHESHWTAGEIGPLSADFNGVLGSGRSIASGAWTSTGPVSLSAPTLAGDVIATTVTTTGRGRAEAEATVTLDNGEKRVQRFVLRVV